MFSFSSSGYLDVSVHRVPSAYLWIQYTVTEVCSAGFPHSDICGSRDICSSPQLFAAYRVFHRLLVPRHPPCALYSLTCCNSSFFGLVTSIHSVVCLLFEIFISFFACFGCLLVYLLLSGWFLQTNFLDVDTLRLFSIFGFQGTDSYLWIPFSRYPVETERFELLTPCLQGRCSPN